MPITKEEIDNFYKFATSQLDGGEAVWSLEECIMLWKVQRSERTQEIQPFPNGISLRDQLDKAGILGRNVEGPDDVASNPKYMEGFGEE